MFFGLDMEKLLLIGVLAAVLIGPERLPKAAEALARFTRQARDWLRGARGRMTEEMGEDFDDIEWRKLDPRQYDPRRIIRDALLDDAPVPTVQAAAVGGAITVAATPPQRFEADRPVPFDDEAT